MITFEDFSKLELKVGTVLEAEEVEGSEKLLKFKVDLGPYLKAESGDPSPASPDQDDNRGRDIRQILAGIKGVYEPKSLTGKQLVVVANLESKTMMGLQSQGMILCADNNGKPVCLMPESSVPNGSRIR